MQIGDKFGLWTVSGGHETRGGKKTFQECTCSCGVVKMVSRHSLVSGASSSCGCNQYKNTPALGLWGSKEYMAFQQAKKRCRNPKDKDYPSYGGRGIQFLWNSFAEFISSVGKAPEGYSLGRKDNDGPYGPGNCEWQSAKTQARNKRNTAMVEYKGTLVSRRNLMDQSSVKPVTIIARLKRGWSVEKALGFSEEA